MSRPYVIIGNHPGERREVERGHAEFLKDSLVQALRDGWSSVEVYLGNERIMDEKTVLAFVGPWRRQQ